MRLESKVNGVKCAWSVLKKQIAELNNSFVYNRFEGDIPQVAIDNKGQIWLDYHGYEMSIETALDYMENVGYIAPDDFF